MSTRRAIGRIAAMLAGLLAWAVQFGIVYGVAGLVCAGRLPAGDPTGLGTIRLATAAATVAALLVIGAAFRSARRRRRAHRGTETPSDDFLAVMTEFVCGLSLVAVLFTAAPAILDAACAPLPTGG